MLELPTALDVEPSNLSRQLAALCRSGTAPATGEGPAVDYALVGGDTAELPRTARRISGRDAGVAERVADGTSEVPS